MPCVRPPLRIINAIYNAIGVRIKELPATAERVLAALQEKEREEVSIGQ